MASVQWKASSNFSSLSYRGLTVTGGKAVGSLHGWLSDLGGLITRDQRETHVSVVPVWHPQGILYLSFCPHLSHPSYWAQNGELVSTLMAFLVFSVPKRATISLHGSFRSTRSRNQNKTENLKDVFQKLIP
jgi:hypothetical protein